MIEWKSHEQAADDDEITKGKKEKFSAAFYCADFRRQAVELDHDEPPDGEGEGEPGGHRVDHHCEVGVEHHEDSPSERILKREVTNLIEKFLSPPLRDFSFLCQVDSCRW